MLPLSFLSRTAVCFPSFLRSFAAQSWVYDPSGTLQEISAIDALYGDECLGKDLLFGTGGFLPAIDALCRSEYRGNP